MSIAFDDAYFEFVEAAADARRCIRDGAPSDAAYKRFRQAHVALLREGRVATTRADKAALDEALRTAAVVVREHAARERADELAMEHDRTVRAWGSSAFDLYEPGD
jgi:predicted RNase H-like nuclease (RuvC/YqgF family)